MLDGISTARFMHHSEPPPGPYLEKKMIGEGGGGANTDRDDKGHCEGEGAGEGCAPSYAKCEAETTYILQSE